jgi:hypothetical protein
VPPKKKPRTPPPPRRVQAPKQRQTVAPSELGMRQRAILYGFAALGVVALIAVIAVFALGGKSASASSKHVAALMTAAGCTFKTVNGFVPAGQGTHVASLTKKLPWNTDPPSNGQHYPQWAVWGFYTNPVNPRMVVHNEEHGGVILWWGTGVSPATVDKLRAFYNKESTGSFGTPYPKLGTKVAITAWTGSPADYTQNGYYGFGHIAKCPTYTAATEKAFTAFRDLYRGHGPEGIPLSADQPGMGP